MADKAIIEEAESHLTEIMPTIERLNSLGISKQLHQGPKTSQIMVTYPPIQSLEQLNADYVYNGGLNGRNTLYVHIPFCTGICTYCSFSRTAASEEDPRINSYLDLLDRESRLLSSRAEDKIPVESIYLGGGTPTLLTERNLERLLKIIRRDFVWNGEIEYTLEGSPETVTVGKVALARHYGVNRTSIGVESFDDETLERIGRRHDAQGAFEAIEIIRKGGVENIDFDLIRGLPGYTPEMMVHDLEGVAQAKVPSVTSYQYSIKPGSIDNKKLSDMSQDEREQILMHLIFNLGMQRLGYNQKPVDFFAIDSKHVYHHQMLKWEDMTNQVVLGISSYGYVNGVQFNNLSRRKDYEESIKQGKLPVARATKLSSEELMRRRFIFGLKTRVDRKEFKAEYGVDPLDSPFKSTIETFVDGGGIEANGEELKLSEAGTLFADWIQMAFYSDEVKQRLRIES